MINVGATPLPQNIPLYTVDFGPRFPGLNFPGLPADFSQTTDSLRLEPYADLINQHVQKNLFYTLGLIQTQGTSHWHHFDGNGLYEALRMKWENPMNRANITRVFFVTLSAQSHQFRLLTTMTRNVLPVTAENSRERGSFLGEYFKANDPERAPADRAKYEYSVGTCYSKGRGVPVDVVEGMVWYRKAAERGNATAQCTLGVCFSEGRDGEVDFEKAIRWFERSAAQGYAHAEHNLGSAYQRGRGVPFSPVEAARWYTKAANHNFPLAQYKISICYAMGDGVDADPLQAFAWAEKAANGGSTDAAYSVGIYYRDGYGVAVDDQKSRFWLQRAADRGNASAKAVLENIENLDRN